MLQVHSFYLVNGWVLISAEAYGFELISAIAFFLSWKGLGYK